MKFKDLAYIQHGGNISDSKEDRLTDFSPGDLVSARQRSWIFLGEDRGVIRLRPARGIDRSVVGISSRLEGDRVLPDEYRTPLVSSLGSPSSARSLAAAARLSATAPPLPFRGMGRIRFSPKPYQLVPLAMALRQEDPIRILIADGVGVGKTVEACLIAGELIERGKTDGLAVLCPSHLCDQWQEELWDKFGIRAEVIRPSNITELERRIPSEGVSVFKHFRFTIASIDYVKSDRYMASLLEDAPGLVVVDEAHTASRPHGAEDSETQKRFRLVKALADDPDRHLVLVTATPHSGVEDSYRSLLGLMNDEFDVDEGPIDIGMRRRIRNHLVQRGRPDLKPWLRDATPFPNLEASEAGYTLGTKQSDLIDGINEYCNPGERRRIGHWGTLGLLRSALSSPAAAVAAIEVREGRGRSVETLKAGSEGFDRWALQEVGDPSDAEAWHDSTPANAILGDSNETTDDREELARLKTVAAKLHGPKHDNKLSTLLQVLEDLLDEDRNVIVFCRYIATVDYLEQQVNRALGDRFRDLGVDTVTGRVPDESRIDRVRKLGTHASKILIATDCMSEGVNLQDHFDSVVHYDLPWNPMRLQQREGRVDRFGQTRSVVKAVIMNGTDSEIDQTVMSVLMRKYRQIQKDMGGTVAMPEDSEGSVTQELIDRVLAKRSTESGVQASFGFSASQLHTVWDRASEAHAARSGQYRNGGFEPQELEELMKAVDESVVDIDVLDWTLPAALRSGEHESHQTPWELAPVILERSLEDTPPKGLSPFAVASGGGVGAPTAFILCRFRHTVTYRGGVDPCEEIRFVRVGLDSTLESPRIGVAVEDVEVFESLETAEDASVGFDHTVFEALVERISEDLSWSEHVRNELSEALIERHRNVNSARRRPPDVNTRTPDVIGLFLLLPGKRGT
jgi:superfamily II DNA or RNA helicase